MVATVDRALVVAQAATAFNAYEFTVRRNVAILFARIRREGCNDTFSMASLAARKADGLPIARSEMRTGDRFAARAVVDSLDALGTGREAVHMLKRIATLLHEVVSLVASLPEPARAQAMEDTVADAVAALSVARPARVAPSA